MAFDAVSLKISIHSTLTHKYTQHVLRELFFFFNNKFHPIRIVVRQRRIVHMSLIIVICATIAIWNVYGVDGIKQQKKCKRLKGIKNAALKSGKKPLNNETEKSSKQSCVKYKTKPEKIKCTAMWWETTAEDAEGIRKWNEMEKKISIKSAF